MTEMKSVSRPSAPGGVIQRVSMDDQGLARIVLGPADSHLHIIEQALEVKVSHQATGLTISGDGHRVQLAVSLIEQLYALTREGRPLFAADIEQAIKIVSRESDVKLRDIFLDTIFVSNRKRVITPMGVSQKKYLDALRRHDVVFAIGPAGTGKTYLAMAMAVAALKKQEVQRIVITRPAVEAGEKLGFLPGDLAEKVNPYLRPLYDALHDMMDPARSARLMEKGVIEVAPLAFMRGRTLNDSFIILDEAQNTTSDQMKMFLTRLGYDSKAVITGDITQVDLPADKACGLIEARQILAGIDGIEFCLFSEQDVVRHPLVSKVIIAYERAGRQRGEGPLEHEDGKQ